MCRSNPHLIQFRVGTTVKTYLWADPFWFIIDAMNKQNKNILLALGAVIAAMDSFSREHPMYLKLQAAKMALILELVNENPTTQ